MATISITYTSSTSYTVSASGLTVGQKYHIFTEDLNTSGSVTGYVCRYSQTATSTSWSSSYTCGSAYSGFTRHVYMYCTGTTATSHSVGTTYSASQLPSSSGGMWSAYDSWSGGSTTSYNITLKVGSGVARISYKINATSTSATTYMLNSSTGSVTRDVGSGGYLYITAVTYDDDYTYPVYATDQTSTPYSSFTVINSSGSFSDHYVSAPSGGGTRIVNISATYAPTYYYRIKAYANGGTFSSGTETYNSSVYSTSDDYVTYYLSNISTPTRDGYVFKGWGSSATSTTVYGSSVTFTVSSTSSNSPTVKEFYAVWEQETYSGYIKLGAGISSAAVYAGGVLKAQISDKAYHELLNLTTGTVISVKSIAKDTGYTRPYTFKFYTTSTATTTTNTLEVDADEPEYSWMRARVYAEIVATKTSIDLFYWSSASTDASLIAAGQPISNLTAARWNKLLAKIAEVAEVTGGSFSYGAVSSGGTFYASEFNEARTGILGLTGYGTLSAAQSSGDEVKAALLEGSGSLKTALNAAITNFNNS